MGIYKYLMGKLPNMHKYLKIYSVLDNLKQEKYGVTNHALKNPIGLYVFAYFRH